MSSNQVKAQLMMQQATTNSTTPTPMATLSNKKENL